MYTKPHYGAKPGGRPGGCHAETSTAGVVTFGSLLLIKLKKPSPTCIFLTSLEWPAFIGSTMYFTALRAGEKGGKGEAIPPPRATICLY